MEETDVKQGNSPFKAILILRLLRKVQKVHVGGR